MRGKCLQYYYSKKTSLKKTITYVLIDALKYLGCYMYRFETHVYVPKRESTQQL